MCYSARVWSDFRKYQRVFGAAVSIGDFARLFAERAAGAPIRVPKALDAAFADVGEAGISVAIATWRRDHAASLAAEVFKQRARQAAAEGSLQHKVTKTAQEEARKGGSMAKRAQAQLDTLKRAELRPQDERVYPGMYAPVIVLQEGRRVLRPMRYRCRPEGRPASYDRRYPGTYNARRDNLDGFWKGQFGAHHALMVAEAFYENVNGTELEYTPRTGEPLLVACLWSPWSGADGELLSFAAITDEPEPEVAATGHDRTVINIKPGNVDAWLNPGGDLQAMQAILEDRQHPFYEHRIAA